MPKKLVSEADILKAWEKKRERDKKAQATWVAKNKEVHLQRMREQYVKKVPKAKTYVTQAMREKTRKEASKEYKNRQMMAMEDKDASKPKRKLRTSKEKENSVMMAMEDKDAPKSKRKLKKKV